jgi:hypothetical protein
LAGNQIFGGKPMRRDFPPNIVDRIFGGKELWFRREEVGMVIMMAIFVEEGWYLLVST